MTIIVGLTGGIASGKSFVASYLKKIKIPTHESDEVVKLLYKDPSNNFLNYLKKNGFEKSISNKKINKKYIRDEIFEKVKKRKILEKYLHKEVGFSRNIFLQKNKHKKIVFLDIPLLFENKLEKKCNLVCSTICPLKIRKQRALKRRNINISLFHQIIKTQITDIERKKKSNYLINTSNTKIKTYLQVDNLIYDILKNYK